MQLNKLIKNIFHKTDWDSREFLKHKNEDIINLFW